MSINLPSPTADKAADEQLVAGHFLLPDLCKIQPLFVLVLVAQLLALVLVLLVSPIGVFNWSHFAKVSFYGLWHVLLCAMVLCQCREQIRALPITPGALLAYGLILLVSTLLNIIGQWLVHHYWLQLSTAWHWDWRSTMSHMAVVAILGGIALRYMYLQQKVQVEEQARLQATIQALQSRIRPHFLFNSMNIVASLIATDPDRAERVVEDISELFRVSLRAGDVLVTVEEELELCKHYIQIEQLRLGDRLRIDWQLNADVFDVKIPSLTLQPLIENAVYHGIQPLVNGGTVTIKGVMDNEVIRLTVSNPVPAGAGFETTELPRGNRIALANTKARLRAHFGIEANVQTINDENRFSAEISYSVKK